MEEIAFFKEKYLKMLLQKIILFCLFIFLTPMEAFMSRIFYDKVSLEEVINWSEIIVCVKKNDPFFTDEVIPIHHDTKKYPPYHKMTFQYRITEILYDGRNLLSIGQIINVEKSDEGYSFENHKRYYLEGFSESPIIRTYFSEEKIDEDRDCEFILFLNYLEKPNRYRFTLEGSNEGVKVKPRIIKNIGEKKKK
jgi:hypothetical protein